jgi:hypothetical protein
LTKTMKDWRLWLSMSVGAGFMILGAVGTYNFFVESSDRIGTFIEEPYLLWGPSIVTIGLSWLLAVRFWYQRQALIRALPWLRRFAVCLMFIVPVVAGIVDISSRNQGLFLLLGALVLSGGPGAVLFAFTIIFQVIQRRQRQAA